MLALITIFLGTFLISAVAIWLYRLIFSWKGVNYRLVGRPRNTMMMKLSAQQGYITLAPKSKKNSQAPVRYVKLRTADIDHRAKADGVIPENRDSAIVRCGQYF